MPETPRTTLSDGTQVYPEHTNIIKYGARKGQQEGYVVLAEEERAKGFVRPVRRSYRHVGAPGPKYPLRALTDDESKALGCWNPGNRFEQYPASESPVIGRIWRAEDLAKIGRACGVVTTMGQTLAETYARDPYFYSGTFCCGCGTHFPVGPDGEFVWDGTNERVGT